MKLHRLLIAFITTIILAAALPKKNDDYFKVSIEQNGVNNEIINNSVVLDKAPFDIVFDFKKTDGVLVHASFDKETFELASKNKHIEKLNGFENTGMAEGLLNKDKEIFLKNSAPSYWFYDSEEKNRFNKTEKKEEDLICTRTIEKLRDIDSGEVISTRDIDQTLYLVFISYTRGEKITERIETDRQFFKIEWK